MIIPNFSAVDVKAGGRRRADARLGRRSACGRVYLLAYMVVALALATLIFRRKEF